MKKNILGLIVSVSIFLFFLYSTFNFEVEHKTVNVEKVITVKKTTDSYIEIICLVSDSNTLQTLHVKNNKEETDKITKGDKICSFAMMYLKQIFSCSCISW